MMPMTNDADTAPALSCSECLEEIPASVANSLEGKDYIHYFCGLECYATWEKHNSQHAESEAV